MERDYKKYYSVPSWNRSPSFDVLARRRGGCCSDGEPARLAQIGARVVLAGADQPDAVDGQSDSSSGHTAMTPMPAWWYRTARDSTVVCDDNRLDL
jgi:hypothetical protein